MPVSAEGPFVVGHLEGGPGAFEDITHLPVGAGEDEVQEPEAEAPQPGGTGAVREELVEDGEPPAGLQDPGRLGEAAGGVGDDLQDHVEDRRVEARVGQVERQAVHLPEGDPGPGVGARLVEHGRGQVDRQDLHPLRHEGNVGPGAAADDQKPLADP